MPMGPPLGIRHGKAVHTFEVVEWVRDLREIDGLSVPKICELVKCIKPETVRDWIYYRTRAAA